MYRRAHVSSAQPARESGVGRVKPQLKTERAGRRRLPARPFRYRPFYEQLPPTSRTEVTRICCVALSLLLLRDELAAPGSVDGLAPAAELELPALFCNVPFTSTFLPTSVEKFEALPLSL